MSEALVEFKHVSKSFGSARALDRVSFELLAGEVHVVAGENGAGKSTLIRILSGVHTDFDGELWIDGARVHFRGPEAAARAGIATIHQELSLVGAMSVADNLMLGEPARLLARRTPRRELARARRLLEQIAVNVDPECSVESLPLAVQQELEIGRALLQNARILVMDEPTSALGEAEAERLFARIGELCERGCGIIYISHRMEEIFRLAHRITVLRDGRHILTASRAELDREQLLHAMLGQRLQENEARPRKALRTQALEVRELTLKGALHSRRRVLDGVRFSLCNGEILGVAGLAGSGASELLHALFGSFGRPEVADVELAGRRFVPDNPRASIARGVVLLASDRRQSLVSELGSVENATLSSLRRWSRFGFIQRDAELAAARDVLQKLSAALSTSAPQSLRAPIWGLSGGNQQKVALARCLLAGPRVLLLDEPTRGIDVRAKADVHALIRELAAQGLAVLLVASEMQELLALADRVLVFHRGRISDELTKQEFSRERVLKSAMGGSADEALDGART